MNLTESDRHVLEWYTKHDVPQDAQRVYAAALNTIDELTRTMHTQGVQSIILQKTIKQLNYSLLKRDNHAADLQKENEMLAECNKSLLTQVEALKATAPSSTSKPEFKVGAVVRLKSGGPNMTLGAYNGYEGCTQEWQCSYFTPSGEYKELGPVPVSELILVNPQP